MFFLGGHMNNSKIYLLNIHFADNYGAVLLTLALQEAFRKEGAEIIILNYTPPKLHYQYSLIFNPFKIADIKITIKLFKLFLLRVLFWPLKTILRRIRFKKFRKRHLNIKTKRIFSPKDIVIESVKSKLIVGSDQVWNPDVVLEYLDDYLLNFNNTCLKFSYAASITKDLDQIEKKMINKSLIAFNMISIRELKTIESQFNDSSLNIQSHIDPTLLHDINYYQSLSKKIPLPKDYMIVYDMKGDRKLRELIPFLENKLQISIITFSNYNYYDKRYPSFKSFGPSEFLYMYSRASYVLTTSYHGLIFSLIYRKKFVALNPNSRKLRMTDLLEKLNIQKKFFSLNSNYDFNEIYDSLISTIDYSQVQNKIDILKKDAFDYIKKIIISE